MRVFWPSRALDPADRCAVSDRRLAGGARNVCREIRDLDFGRLEVGRDLEQTDAVLGEREQERAVGEGDRPEERLEMKAVRDLDHAGEIVRQPEGPARRRR
jgi:hypothetical protein